jgi:steroid 5-alpha reductase family enzyme
VNLGIFLAVTCLSVAAILILMAATFVVALRVGRHSVIDVIWGLGFVLIAVVSLLTVLANSAGGGLSLQRAVLMVLVTAWGVRLAVHIGRRAHGAAEDPRYVALLAKAPGNKNRYALRKIYLTQAVVLWFISLPVQVGMATPGKLTWLGWIGAALWAVGFVFESVGDLQLTRFGSDPANKGRVLDTGLWKYTRHPNYFGDACVWWGISLIAFAQWPGILTILSPIFMTFLLAKGTGKPLLESRMATTRTGYADYVRRTSGFLPLPPRPGHETTAP